MATAILLPAMASVAFVFVYAAAATKSNRDRAACTLLASEKFEQLQAAAPASAAWAPGQYSEYLRIAQDGLLVASPSASDAPYLRMWQIAGGSPPLATVIVSSLHAGLAGKPMECARATMSAP